MQTLLDTLAGELARSRPLLKQVADHLCAHYSLGRDELAAFLADQLDSLEDYEIDLIFSPLFTPTLEDQAAFSDLLEAGTIPPAAWPELVRQLAARPVIGRVVVEGEQSVPVKLRPVVIERFVDRLNLDRAPAPQLTKLLRSLPPVEDRSLLKALARRPIWESDARREILFRFLLATASGEGYERADPAALLKLMETYQPRDAAEVLTRLPHWLEVKRKEIATANLKPFFNERIRDMHGGERDQRAPDQPQMAVWQAELAFLERLQRVLAS
jgi:hypothetical protein